MPLSPKDILPAIPRQKVKNNITGEIGGVIHYVEERKNFDDVLIVKLESGELGHWDIKRCELLPEEPREFKVGDKIAYELGPKARKDMIGLSQYAIVEGIQSDGCALICGTKLRKEEDMQYLRHATPLEISKYFN
jgi:hypothetical protein